MLMAVMEDSGYLREFQSEDTPESRVRMENLQELVAAAQEFEQREEGATVESFLANLALASDLDELDDDASYVTLMTLHAAKGLEYPVVFLTGLEDGLLPSKRALDDADPVGALEEERRLTYVGVTRAIERSVHVARAAPLALRQHRAPRAIALLGRDAERSANRYAAGGAPDGRTLA